jgi:nitric oxide dioxygenase
MTTDGRLLRDTLEIAMAQEGFGQRFYARLFAAQPQLRPMFKTNSEGAQQKMFAQKLCAIVDNLDDPELLRAEAHRIATTHRGYGVTAEMYAWVGTALIDSLRESTGDVWSDEAERAWKGAYAILARAIVSEQG